MRKDDLKSLQPCLVPMPNTTIRDIDSQAKIAKQKCDDQIWMTGREILQEKPVQQLTGT